MIITYVSIDQEDIFLDVYASNLSFKNMGGGGVRGGNRTTRIDQSMIIVGKFHLSQKTENLYGYFNPFNLNDIYKPRRPAAVESRLF